MSSSASLRARRIAAASVAAPLAMALSALWFERRPIAREFIDRELARRGVRAAYVLASIGPRAERLDHLRIGDPAHPDLVAERATVLLGWGLRGPYARAIVANGVRIAGRVTAAGKLSLGEIDRLMPPPSSAPFALPDLDLTLDDAMMRLATPAGQIVLSLQGSGNLRGGFAGHFGAVATALDYEGCRLSQPSAFLAISIARRQPALDGPIRAAALACPGKQATVNALWLTVKARLGEHLDRWTGATGFALGALGIGGQRLAAVRGIASFDGDPRRTGGTLALATGAATLPHLAAARLGFDGRYELYSGSAFGISGHATAGGAAADRAWGVALRRGSVALADTPLAPLAARFADAFGEAASRFDVGGDIAIARQGGADRIDVQALDLVSASGARLLASGDRPLRFQAGRGVSLDGNFMLGGGGLPDLAFALRRADPAAPLTGGLRMQPYAAGGARLTLTPVTFVADGRRTRFSGQAVLDGPLPGGGVKGLTLPIAGSIAGDGSLTIGDRCGAIGFDALAAAGVRFGATRLNFCPRGVALIARDWRGRFGGGGELARPRLIGTLGRSPLTIAADAIGFDVAQASARAAALAIRLGPPDAQTRLDVAALSADRGARGRFAGLAGSIAHVPLLVRDAHGAWGLRNGVIELASDLNVSDAAMPARFNPLAAKAATLTLAAGVIRAAGTLSEPKSGRRVGDVTIVHELSTGRGNATLNAPRLSFDAGFQPDMLTPLTTGVVADVKGSVSGTGHIAWDAAGVTSNGRFTTDDLALAAAFGPVSGIKGTIRFDDLLGLHTPPHQQLTLGQVNPGIAVFGGQIRYQLLGDERVQIESGGWPLSGGMLTLQPSLLDFGHPVARRFEFAVAGLDAGQFIEQFKLDNIAATGTFDGVLPMIFDDKGGRIVGGRLIARPGGGRLSYVGDVSNAQLGTFGKLAFDALKSIRYQALEIDLDGALDGEVVSRVEFTGINDKPSGVAPAKGFARSFTNLPFKFNIVVRAPFRGLMNSASDFADPGPLLHERQPLVQGQESGSVGEKP